MIEAREALGCVIRSTEGSYIYTYSIDIVNIYICLIDNN